MKPLWKLAAVILLIGMGFAQAAERRVALVIGNNAYPSGALINPKNDATAVADAFRKLGVDVELVTDASKASIDAAFKRFGNRAENAEVAIVFYAGHGVQVNGFNYLVPIDAHPQSERDLKREMVKLDDVIEDMGKARVRLVFFDACRDNPLSRSFSRSGSRGLAPPVETSGTLISFATKHGNTASDGEGRHSPYTETLLSHLQRPTDEVHVLLRKVNQGVRKITLDKQEPWTYGSLDGDFYFLKPSPAQAAAPAQTVSAAPSTMDAAQVELEFWRGTQQTNTAEAYQLYLDEYPNGRFARLAVVSLKKLSGGKAVPAGKPALIAAPADEQREKVAADEPAPAATPAGLFANLSKPLATAREKAVAEAAKPADKTPEEKDAAPPAASQKPTPAAKSSEPEKLGNSFALGDARYTGRFVANRSNGSLSGEGRIEWANGDTYEGKLENSVRQGYGVSTDKRGQRYEGDWRNDQQVGQAKVSYPNGDRYEGQVNMGEPDGQGTYTWVNGSRYIGAWVQGRKHGKGRFVYPDGDAWEGEFIADQQAEGRMTFAGAAERKAAAK